MRRTVNAVELLRTRRALLPALAFGGFAMVFVGSRARTLAPWLGGDRLLHRACAALLLGCAAAALYLRRRGEHFSAREQALWTATIALLSALGGGVSQLLGGHLALVTVAVWAFALRDPTDRWRMLAIASVGLLPGVALALGAASGAGAGLLSATAVSAGVQAAAVLLALQTRRYREVWLQREAQLAAPPAPPRVRRVEAEAAPRAPERTRGNTARRNAAAEGVDDGWDALVEKLRLGLAQQAEPTGAATRVEAETGGLAPPSSRLRTHLPRIAQEVVAHALRAAAARNVVLRLRRGEGGVVLEVQDDGDGTEAQRNKRTVAPLRGRVAALGGRAELRRVDHCWLTQVKLPADWLN